jgi:hypothetical protein
MGEMLITILLDNFDYAKLGTNNITDTTQRHGQAVVNSDYHGSIIYAHASLSMSCQTWARYSQSIPQQILAKPNFGSAIMLNRNKPHNTP